MSQAKVEYKKAEKANRKSEVKKRKTAKAIRVTLTTIICLVVVGWVGYSAYGKITTAIENNKNAAPTEYQDIDLSGITDYLYSLSE